MMLRFDTATTNCVASSISPKGFNEQNKIIFLKVVNQLLTLLHQTNNHCIFVTRN